MKLCICLSGQIRDNSEVSFEALKKLISDLEKDGVETTLVFSIWDEISRKLEGIINIKQLNKMFHKDVIPLIPPAWYGKKLWTYLPKTYQHIMNNESKNAVDWVKKYFPDAIIDSEDGHTLDLFIYNSPTNDINSKKMLYKVWRANEMKKKIERDSGEKFDYVVRVRPDYTIQELKLDLDKDYVYIPNAREEHTSLEDTFAMGSSESIDYYCELFPKSISSTYRWKGIHYMLSEHFREEAFPQFKVKSAQESGLKLRHMAQNTNMLDFVDLAQDLSSNFYKNIFEAIQLKRENTSESLDKAIEIMIKNDSCEDEDSCITFFVLLHDLYLENEDYGSALKTIIMADLNYITLNARTFGWDHRMNFIFDLILSLLTKLNWKFTDDIIEKVASLECNSYIDNRFAEVDKTKILENFEIFSTSDKGKEKLAQQKPL